MFQIVTKIVYGHTLLKLVKIDDVSESHLVIAISYKDNLQVPVPVFGDEFVENVGQQPAPFLNRVQPRRPEKYRGAVILNQTQLLL